MAADVTETFSTTPSSTTEVVRQTDEAANVRRRGTLPAQFAQGGGLRRFRKLMSRGIFDEPVMPIDRLWDTEQLLQQQMHAGRPEQVPAPHHVGNALQGVVDHDGQVIARRRLLARQDDVAPGLGLCGDDAALAAGTLATLFPGQSPGIARTPPPCRAAARKARLCAISCSRWSGGSDFAGPG